MNTKESSNKTPFLDSRPFSYCVLPKGEAALGTFDAGKVLGLSFSPENPLELIQIIRSGLPIKALKSFSRALDMSNDDLAKALSLSLRTIKRYREKKETDLLSPEISEHLLQLSEMFTKAVEVFGDKETALEWLREPIPGLGGQRPISILDTTLGIELVKNELVNIEHGIFS